MSHGKSISVAMCTYNGEKFLKEQLESIAAQTRLPMELVICDDGSTDSTIDIVEAFTSSSPFPVDSNSIQ
jgi:glycosyltransferase involved in cell wall biosynthesis